MRSEMHKTTRSRNKQGGALRIRSSAIHPRGSAPTASKGRPATMIDCYEHEDQTQPLVMIECSVCKHAAYSTTEYEASEALINGGSVSRHCHHCGITTMWRQFDLLPVVRIGYSAADWEKSCIPSQSFSLSSWLP